MGESEPTHTYHSMIEYVDALRLHFVLDTANAEFEFSLLMEKTPIKKTYHWCCKVLAIILSTGKTIYYDELQEKDLLYVNVKENARRKMGIRKNPWFIDGNSKINSHKGNEYIEFSFRNAGPKDLKFVEKMRTKFNIIPPRDFVGKALHFNDDKIFDEN